jgi:5-methylcytosine-specific restriction endonuclease McrA
LDVDHKDGKHKNNSEDNLQTLCANCHRLKTKRNKETANKYRNSKTNSIEIIQ